MRSKYGIPNTPITPSMLVQACLLQGHFLYMTLGSKIVFLTIILQQFQLHKGQTKKV